MRVLVGFGDTEGTPHVKTNNSELWNIAILFKHVTSGEKVDDIFHVAHLVINKRAQKNEVKDSLRAHFQAVEYIRDMYQCDKVHVGFWNAPHDIAVLNSYQEKYPIHAFDLLKMARERNKDIKSFNIGKLCDEFGVECSEKVHTGLGDVIRMVSLLPHLGISTSEWNQTIRTDPKHVETPTRKILGDGVGRPTKKGPIRTPPLSNTDEIAKLSIRLARKLKL